MSTDRPRRVMWLLNHGTARKFEVPMLKRAGYTEVFLPKSFPDFGFRSASIDYSEDANLTIPPEDLALMNATDWYGEPSKAAWDVANRHFDTIFFIQHFPEFMRNAAQNFKGVMVWRVYGREKDENYDHVLRRVTRDRGAEWLRSLGERFVFGMAYDHIHETEPDWIRKRAVYLPLGLADCSINDKWEGKDERVLFICPDFEWNPYYTRVWSEFDKDFGDLPHAIGGVQAIASERKNVLGFVPLAQHEENMRQMRLMFYHSREPSHVHYHPFEAVRAGMPLVFMSDGLLDQLGGRELPGRAKTIRQARTLIKRLQAGDRGLADRIRASQGVLLRDMEPDRCAPHWVTGMAQIAGIADRAAAAAPKPHRAKRVAILLPVVYRGGSLNAVRLVADAIRFGAEQTGQAAEVILGYPDDSGYTEADFENVPDTISLRPFRWQVCDPEQSRRIMTLNGDSSWSPVSAAYQVPDDGITGFADADLWLVISNRIENPLLPMRPVVGLVYDYVQRYFRLWDKGHSYHFLHSSWLSDRMMVTTQFTKRDAILYGGIHAKNLARVPILVPPAPEGVEPSGDTPTSFLWATNASPHKNHIKAVEALSRYYEDFSGTLKCVITGVGTDRLLTSDLPHLVPIQQKLNQLIDRGVVVPMGYLDERSFARQLARSAFLWHPATIDNGTFSVVEAAYLGVPSLSSDYPAMREMDDELNLGLTFSASNDALGMARKLQWMAANFVAVRGGLPTADHLQSNSAARVGPSYWREIEKFL